jgi:hypothetical protein
MSTLVIADVLQCFPNKSSIQIPHDLEVDGTLNAHGNVVVAGQLSSATPFKLPSFIKTALPTADAVGELIYVSNATGAHVTGSICFSTATGTANWIDVTTGVAVA